MPFKSTINHQIYPSVPPFRTGIPLSREEAKRVLAKFSSNGRSVRYKDFLRSFSSREVQARDRELAAVSAEQYIAVLFCVV